MADIFNTWPSLIAVRLASFQWPLVEVAEVERLLHYQDCHVYDVAVCEFTGVVRKRKCYQADVLLLTLETLKRDETRNETTSRTLPRFYCVYRPRHSASNVFIIIADKSSARWNERSRASE